MRFLRSQENIHNMPTTLYVMKNALNHFNTIVPLITLIMLFRSQRTCVLICLRSSYDAQIRSQ